VDDTLIVSSDVNLLHEKKLLSSRLIRKLSVKCISLKELKFTEKEEKGYYDYRIGMLRKVSKEIKYLCG
jgi:hypothetical protein